MCFNELQKVFDFACRLLKGCVKFGWGSHVVCVWRRQAFIRSSRGHTWKLGCTVQSSIK